MHSRRWLVLGAVVVVFGALGGWLWQDLRGNRQVYVVGDSITVLSRASITSELGSAGYEAIVSAKAGAKIGQAKQDVERLAHNQPWAWIVELGTWC